MIQLDKERRVCLKRLQKKAGDRREFVKITAILMLDSGFKREEIAESLGIDAATLFRYQADYATKKLEEYLTVAFVGRQSRLSADRALRVLVEKTNRIGDAKFLHNSVQHFCPLRNSFVKSSVFMAPRLNCNSDRSKPRKRESIENTGSFSFV